MYPVIVNQQHNITLQLLCYCISVYQFIRVYQLISDITASVYPMVGVEDMSFSIFGTSFVDHGCIPATVIAYHENFKAEKFVIAKTHLYTYESFCRLLQVN